MIDQDLSVLKRAGPGNVLAAPFAHLELTEAVDPGLYATLAAGFPPPERFTRGMRRIANNQAIRIPARDIVDNPEFTSEWRRFFAYHTSPAFWADIVRVMGGAIRAAHPMLEQRVGRQLEEWTVARRGSGGAGDVELDALFVVNTPVREATSVRPAHVDKEREIWAGLLYMRPPEDATAGGDLALYRFKDRPAFGGHYAPLSSVNEVKRAAYAANTLVAFINSPQSVHGVTPRSPTPLYRRYINLVADVPFDAFRLPKMSPLAQLRFWLERRKTKSSGISAKAY